MVPARLYFCRLGPFGTLAYDFQSTEGAAWPDVGPHSAPLVSEDVLEQDIEQAKGFTRATGDILGCHRSSWVLGWHPPQLCSPRSGGKAVSKASVSSAQHLGAAVARLHGKIITPNLLRELHPLGKH